MKIKFLEETALNRLIHETHLLSQEFVTTFNGATDPDFKSFLNEISPNLIAIKMLMQDRLRLLQEQQQEQPVQ